MVSLPVLVSLALAITVLLELLTLRLVSRAHLLAEVNERSSHETPTPTMGGIAIVLTCLGFLLCPAFYTPGVTGFVVAALGAVAAIGLIDDLISLSARLRMLVHMLAAALALYALGDGMGLSWWQIGFSWVAVLWFLNLYNFMDGIDGIATVQS